MQGRWGARRRRVCIRHSSVLRPPARYNGEPRRRSRVTLAQIRRSCLYFCERQGSAASLFLPLSLSLSLRFLNAVDLGIRVCPVVDAVSREILLATILGICSYELATWQLQSREPQLYTYCIIKFRIVDYRIVL